MEDDIISDDISQDLEELFTDDNQSEQSKFNPTVNDGGSENFGSTAEDEVEVVEAHAWVPSRINSLFPLSEMNRRQSSDKLMSVLVTHENVPAVAINKLKENFNVVILKATDTQEEILNKSIGVDGIFQCSHAVKIDREMLDFIGDKLKVVGLMNAEYDHVNVRQLVKRKVKIGSTKSVLSDCIAEFALCLALTVAHRFKEGYLNCNRGSWGTSEPDWLLGKQLCGSVCGIVGFGDIGLSIAKRLVPFNVKRIIYSGHGRKQAAEDGSVEFVEFPVLLSESDFIFVSCPLTDETKHMFDYKTFLQVKSSCVFINVGRGGVVKTDDLVKALRERLLWGAGLDVTDPEPLPHNHPLLYLDNCFVSPHIGSATMVTRDAMALLTADNITAALQNEPMPCEVCFKPDPPSSRKSIFEYRQPRRTLAKHTLIVVSEHSKHA